MNEIITLPTIEQINCEHRLAFNKAGEAVQHATNCGLMLLQIKASLNHGDWLPWLQGAIERGELAFGARQAQRYLRRASNTTSMSYLAAPALQEALEIFSDQEPAEPQGPLIDVETERKAREEAEAKAEAERQAREQADARWKETVAYHQKRAESTQHELTLERQRSAEWKDQWKAERDKPKKAEVPPDYDALKQTERDLRNELADLKQQQRDLVQQQVVAKLTERQREIDDLESKARAAQHHLDALKRQIDGYSSQERELEVHLEENERARVALARLAANMAGWDGMVTPEAERLKWVALADMMEQGAAAIRHFVGDAKPAFTVIAGGAA